MKLSDIVYGPLHMADKTEPPTVGDMCAMIACALLVVAIWVAGLLALPQRMDEARAFEAYKTRMEARK